MLEPTAQIIEFPNIELIEDEFKIAIVRLAYAIAALPKSEVDSVVQLVELISQDGQKCREAS